MSLAQSKNSTRKKYGKITKNQHSENYKLKGRKQYRIWRNKQNMPEETPFRTIRQGKTPSAKFLSSLEACSSWWKIKHLQETEIIPSICLQKESVLDTTNVVQMQVVAVQCRLLWHLVTLSLSGMNSQTHLAFLFLLLLEYRYRRLQLSK